MTIQPTVRIAGSSHILRYQGLLVPETVAPTTTQTSNAAVITGIIAGAQVVVKFALADMTDLGDPQTELPSTVYDDTQPAAASPHGLPANTLVSGPAIAGGVISIAGVPTGKTYAQNIRVRAHELPSDPLTPMIAAIQVLVPQVEIDTTTTGLLQNSGMPIVGILFAFTAAGIAALFPEQGPPDGVPVVVEIEVPHSIGR